MQQDTLFPTNTNSNSLVNSNSDTARAIQEVQASLIIAKRFPRDQNQAYLRIMKACERPTLAKGAMYAYPRAKQLITGPSIRLAEAVAQNWGNLNFGIREISQENGVSEVEAFAWDVETNTKQVKIFKVPHVRHTKNGSYALTDPRDIYETVANQGARRLRACILAIVPGDIIDAAIEKCERTLAGGDKPIEDMAREMLVAFDKIGVSKDMIEERIGHKINHIIGQEIIELRKIYSSIKDGMAKREDFFTLSTNDDKEETKEEGFEPDPNSFGKGLEIYTNGQETAPKQEQKKTKEKHESKQKPPQSSLKSRQKNGNGKSSGVLSDEMIEQISLVKQEFPDEFDGALFQLGIENANQITNNDLAKKIIKEVNQTVDLRSDAGKTA